MARVKHVKVVKKHTDNPTLRMYHGPLHPRDAGRPLSPGVIVGGEARREADVDPIEAGFGTGGSRGREAERVPARTAVVGVLGRVSADPVRVVPAVEPIDALAADDQVLTGLAIDSVVLKLAEEPIRTRPPVDLIAAWPAEDRVIAVTGSY